MNPILANWKTTLAGVVVILTALLPALGVTEVPPWATGIAAAIGLFVAKDAQGAKS